MFLSFTAHKLLKTFLQNVLVKLDLFVERDMQWGCCARVSSVGVSVCGYTTFGSWKETRC